jgi:hypothetical protein
MSCDVGAGNGQIRACAVLARTQFFDAIETVLQRTDGDHKIAAARIQIIRIRAWAVLGGVKSINSMSKVRNQPRDLPHGRCRHNAALSSDVNLVFHFKSLQGIIGPNRLNPEQFDEIGAPIGERGGEVKNFGPLIHQIF